MTDMTDLMAVREEAVAIIGEDRVPHDVLVELIESHGREPQSPIEMEKYLEEHAGLLHQVGEILMDRRENDDEAPLIWEYLYENMHGVYDQFGKVIDEVEVQVFG